MDKEPSMGATDEADRLAAVVNDPSGQVCYRKAFARFIDHVSEVAKEWLDAWECGKLAPITTRDKTKPFILPDPEPDVLAEAVKAAGYATLDAIEPEFAADLRNELAKRGYEIRKVRHDR